MSTNVLCRAGRPAARSRRPRWWPLGLAYLCALAAAGCGERAESPEIAPRAPTGEAQAQWSLTSQAFPNEAEIPAKHTCDGQDISPHLSWSDPPEGTVELALVCDDPDAPGGTWVHWVLYGLPADQRSLPEAVARSETLPALGGAKQGRNSWGEIGYRGPCPPPGPAHHYHFRLYALNAAPALQPGATKAKLEEAMKGRTVAQTELIGLYSH